MTPEQIECLAMEAANDGFDEEPWFLRTWLAPVVLIVAVGLGVYGALRCFVWVFP